MNRRSVVLLLLISSPVWAAVRPPAMGPADIPFEYDPNLCPSEIVDFVITEPNLSVVYAFAAHNRWGLHIDSEVIDTNGVTDVLVQRLDKVRDPNGGWNQYWQCIFTPGSEGVKYLEIIATDKIGRQDHRTLLVLVVHDEPPFIFPASMPIITKTRMKDAQRLIQYAKKRQFFTTKPTRIWR